MVIPRKASRLRNRERGATGSIVVGALSSSVSTLFDVEVKTAGSSSEFLVSVALFAYFFTPQLVRYTAEVTNKTMRRKYSIAENEYYLKTNCWMFYIYNYKD